jgi:phosphatidate cytidylyltransferase
MQALTKQRLFGASDAFDHPVTVALVIAVGVMLVAAPIMVRVLRSRRQLSDEDFVELKKRCRSWVLLSILIIGPILLGAAWVILGMGLLSLLCYQEFARATGLFRHRLVSAVVVIGIILLTFSVFDHWYGLFVAMAPLTMILLAALSILNDQPKGYIQRVALAVFAFLYLGFCLGHIGYLANAGGYRPILAWLFLSVELNDVFAYLSGRWAGRRKLCPNTSPNKTLGGALGALVLTTMVAACVGHFVFQGQIIDHPVHLITLGVIISISGQFGDLLISSIKRDLCIKDMGVSIPGHGGVLDRFDSLILVGPAVFHYVGYFQGVGLDQPTRIITGM